MRPRAFPAKRSADVLAEFVSIPFAGFLVDARRFVRRSVRRGAAPINRVQPNALAKSFFVGAVGDPEDDPEFYYRPTVVDVDYGAGQSSLFTASYAQTLVRVRWEVSEDLLLARLSYDRIDGTSGELRGGERRARSSPRSRSTVISTSSAAITRRPAKS